MTKWAIIIGGCYRTFETEEEAKERLAWLENLIGRKGRIQEIKVG